MLYEFTEVEKEQVLTNFFTNTDPLQISVIPSKLKKQYIVLCIIINQFQKGASYSEKEVNNILGQVHFDFASLRRGLIDFRLLERTRDGSSYWVKEN